MRSVVMLSVVTLSVISPFSGPFMQRGVGGGRQAAVSHGHVTKLPTLFGDCDFIYFQSKFPILELSVSDAPNCGVTYDHN
jgi:hypothetical protein